MRPQAWLESILFERLPQAVMIGVDLFCGAGGMTLSAKMAGIHVAFAVEADPHAATTYAANHPEVFLRKGDIRSVKWIPLCAWKQETVLFGGPPCQGFSTSNQRTRNTANRVHAIRYARYHSTVGSLSAIGEECHAVFRSCDCNVQL